MASNRINGITIEIAGDTTKLDKALAGTDKQLKATQTNLKDVERLLKLDPGNVDLLTQKQRLLTDAVEGTKERLRTLETAAEQAYQKLSKGEISQQQFDSLNRELIETQMNLEEVTRTADEFDIGRAVQEAQGAVNGLGSAASGAAGDMGRLGSAAGGADSNVGGLGGASGGAAGDVSGLGGAASGAAGDLDRLGGAAEDASGDLDGLSGASGGLSGGLGGLSGIVGGVSIAIGQKLVEGAMAAAEWLWNLDEATEEYREAMGKLNTAFEAAGFDAETAKEAYEGFYKILGDTDTATEASQLLAQLVDNEEDVAKWTEIAAGVYGTFGDALPIEGLIEAANETAKTGQVTGALADALNWVGMSEDEFNDILSRTADEGARAQLIMNNLGMAYEDASDSFYKNNETLIQARENQMLLDQTQAELGESVADLKAKFFDLFGPALIGSIQAVTGIIWGIQIVIDTIGKALDWLGKKIQGVIGFFQELFGAGQQASNMSVGGAASSRGRSVAEPYSLMAATPENIPYLARGTVTRPNNPFLAVVGDNPTEPEIVSPLSTIEQAVRNVVGGGGAQSSVPRSANITLVLNGSVIGRVFTPLVDGYHEIQGVNLVKT